MSTYDERGRALAIRKLAPKAQGGKGQTVVLESKTKAPYDPQNTANTPSVPSTQDSSGLRFNYEQREIDGTNILVGDCKFMLSPVTTAGADVTPPTVGQRIQLQDLTWWLIKTAAPFKPADVVCYYDLQLRGSK